MEGSRGPGAERRQVERILVDRLLKVREEIRCALHLVEDHVPGMLAEESTRILSRVVPDVERLERHVFAVREGHAAEGGLARLAGPRDRHTVRSGQVQFLQEGRESGV